MPPKLSRSAFAFRSVHALIAIGFLWAIGYIWWCALTGRRDRRLTLAITSLAIEGVLVLVNEGDCPLGGLQERLGDPTPLFELILSPRAAKQAVPVLGGITAAGVAMVAARGPGRAAREEPGPGRADREGPGPGRAAREGPGPGRAARTGTRHAPWTR